ncbi:hypothetical protein RhiirA4_489881 [Rhizophagus irregularis]|uniref:Uncharacterized protein n=1 Tax=Rhizophagus irregularis TaxID=588596 RepID=A0A2I1HV76_9GLOM|nr:hypothetical protein RhiirA4_489881 [Rhizophagus irregularis]
MAENAEVSAEMDEIEVIEDSEPTGMEDSEPTGMEESEPTGAEESEPMGVEESLETEDETDKWYKFIVNSSVFFENYGIFCGIVD